MYKGAGIITSTFYIFFYRFALFANMRFYFFQTHEEDHIRTIIGCIRQRILAYKHTLVATNLITMFLTPEAKAYYLKDFEQVLSIPEGYQKVADTVRNDLIKINEHPCIQTLFHSTYSTSSDSFIIGGISSLTIAYCSHLEDRLKTYLHTLEKEFIEAEYFYFLRGPSDNSSYNPASPHNIGCYKNPDYFRLKHFEILIESEDLEIHDKFFTLISIGLSRIY